MAAASDLAFLIVLLPTLSFLLSIPASLGAGLLVVVDEGVPTIPVPQAVLALGVSAVVGYLTVGALVALVRRVAFWGVCVGFGALAGVIVAECASVGFSKESWNDAGMGWSEWEDHAAWDEYGDEWNTRNVLGRDLTGGNDKRPSPDVSIATSQ
jgi:hypothetical protein